MSRWLRRSIWAALPVLAATNLVAADEAIDLDRARGCFEQARLVSERDGGRLWGRELYGAMLFVDWDTRAVVANRPDREGYLTARGDVYTGVLPENVTIANTATHWAGEHWTMLIWPLPDDDRERARLLAHEMWHRVQDALGLPGSNPGNAHLDGPDGRLWLRLEWRALARALRAAGAERTAAVSDALVFRRYRRSLFDGAASEELALENNEGLAEYTGVVLAGFGEEERAERAAVKLAEAEAADSFVRSFAYKSGPAWGLLLDEADDEWRTNYGADDDLGDRLAAALKLTPPDDLAGAARARMESYGGDEIEKEENRREQRRQQRMSEARARFVDGPTLRIPLREVQIGFDPGNLQPLEGVGTVYPTMRVSDVWGILEVSDGALLSADWTWIAVPVDAAWSGDLTRTGRGWTLDLDGSWEVVPGDSERQWRLAPRR